ncbi:hypothetical protein O181_044111 [Austropuccinia psidii MF-1]|uniref:OTU domain-containing protein n=1 Tax=Austropuccinia psidii MF-1 TaxID=1389203 RepID=A0A9Q3DPT0_9BASI|nr:hypothetical protein [Austropuccinia psidii MF-1]
MAEITLILQNFQDVFTVKVPFDQIFNSQEDDQYYEDPLEFKNICGRPQAAKNKNENKNKRELSRFEIIESQSKRRGRPPSKVTSTKTSRSKSCAPSPIMEVDSSKDSEASLSKSISSSDSLPPETELNEYRKSGVTLKSSRILAMGSKTSQRKSHKPETSLKIYDAIDLTCEHCQRNYHTNDECSKIFVAGSEDLPNFIFKYTFKAIKVQGDGNCGYRAVSHYIYKTHDQWADFRGDLAEEIEKKQDLYEAMNTLFPSVTSDLNGIEWYEDFGQAPKSKCMSMPDIRDPIANKYKIPVFFYSTAQYFSFFPYFCPPNDNPPILNCFLDSCSHFIPLDIIISKVFPVPSFLLIENFIPNHQPWGGKTDLRNTGGYICPIFLPPS